MLTVTAKHDEAGIYSISAEGHTGFADAGSDIVCASVSSLIQALWLGLEDVIALNDLEAVSDPEIPLMRLEWESGAEAARILARTILLSIKTIADNYPGYVTVEEVFESTRRTT
jgi:uncharacterized protein YsxB (DUF464 family)